MSSNTTVFDEYRTTLESRGADGLLELLEEQFRASGRFHELFEVLTLIQTRKVNKKLPVVLYGKEYWHNLINFDALVENMMINKEDMDLIYFAESNQDAFDYLTSHLNGDSE